MGIINAIAGNLQPVDPALLHRQYGAFLFDGEKLTSGFQLLRDAVVFTNYRILFVDRQGATGVKSRYRSVYLDSIIGVECETAGSTLDDSEIIVQYIVDVNQRKTGPETHDRVILEFPKQFDLTPLYRYLGNLAMSNRKRINGIDPEDVETSW